MELGLALLERIDGDTVLSPYGLARALATIRDGATGATRAALELIDPVPEVDGILSAQAVWLDEGYTPGPALDGLDTGPLDLERINAWSNEKTRGMIPRILDSLERDEIFVLTDAEYLDAKWVHPFEGSRRAPFDGAGEVTLMRVEGDVRARRGRDPAPVRGRRPALHRRDGRAAARVVAMATARSSCRASPPPAGSTSRTRWPGSASPRPSGRARTSTS